MIIVNGLIFKNLFVYKPFLYLFTTERNHEGSKYIDPKDKLNIMLRNGMATKWCFIMTPSYPATRKTYVICCMFHGLILVSSV